MREESRRRSKGWLWLCGCSGCGGGVVSGGLRPPMLLSSSTAGDGEDGERLDTIAASSILGEPVVAVCTNDLGLMNWKMEEGVMTCVLVRRAHVFGPFGRF